LPEVNTAPILLYFLHCASFAHETQQYWRYCKDRTFQEKNIINNAAPLRSLVGVTFARNKNRNMSSKYSINQGIDGFPTFQAMNTAPIFLFLQLGACSRMKFDKVGAVGI